MTAYTVNPNYPTPLELAEVAYRGCVEGTRGKTFDGREMPQWADLPERTMRAWVAAVVAIQVESARGTVYVSEPVPGAAAATTASWQHIKAVNGVLEHSGAACWCGPTVTEAGIGHRCNLGEVHQLNDPGEV